MGSTTFRALLFAGFLVATRLPAQEARAPQAMTLEQALTFARTHQPDLAAARARTGAARADTGIPRGQWLPQIGATAQLFADTENNSTAAYLGLSNVPLPRIGATPGTQANAWQPFASTLVAAGIRQELFDFGRIAAQAAAADARLTVQQEKESAIAGDLELEVTNSFYLVLASHDIVGAAQRALGSASLANDEAQQSVKAGLRAQIDLFRAGAGLAHAQVGVERATASLLVAQGNLAAAIGSAEPLIDATGGAIPEANLPAMRDAIAQALEHDPDIRAALASEYASQQNTRAVRAELRPDLFLSASASARAGGAKLSNGSLASGDGFAPTVPNWDVGVVFAWPIYDGVVSARTHAAAAREQVAAAEFASLKQRIVASVQQAWTRAQSALQAMPSLEKAAEAARANEQQSSARFKGGLGTSLDVADSEQLLVQSEVELAAGRFDYARARAQLTRLTKENNK